MTTKGQVTVPQPMRDRPDLKPGSEVEFRVGRDGDLVLKGKSEPKKIKPARSHAAAIRGTANFGMSTGDTAPTSLISC